MSIPDQTRAEPDARVQQAASESAWPARHYGLITGRLDGLRCQPFGCLPGFSFRITRGQRWPVNGLVHGRSIAEATCGRAVLANGYRAQAKISIFGFDATRWAVAPRAFTFRFRETAFPFAPIPLPLLMSRCLTLGPAGASPNTYI